MVKAMKSGGALALVIAMMGLSACEDKDSIAENPSTERAMQDAENPMPGEEGAPPAMPAGDPASGSAMGEQSMPGASAEDSQASSSQPTAMDNALPTILVAGVRMKPADEWVREQPSGSMRAAQFRASGEAGELEVVVYGRGIGGSVEQNIERWINQISNHVGEPERGEIETNGLTISWVEVTGTYGGGMGPMSGGAPEAGTTLLGAVISGGPSGNIFIKATGDKAMAAQQQDAWMAFLNSAERAI